MMRGAPLKLGALLGWLALSFGAAAVGAVASRDAGGFYLSLERPGWAPPAWLFAPVWTVLYFLQGVAAWLVWRARGWGGALALFCSQLALNALWTWLFFAWHLGAAAFVEPLLLWALIVATVLAFWRVRPVGCRPAGPVLALGVLRDGPHLVGLGQEPAAPGILSRP
jgi:benzodiazapine receptor